MKRGIIVVVSLILVLIGSLAVFNGYSVARNLLIVTSRVTTTSTSTLIQYSTVSESTTSTTTQTITTTEIPQQFSPDQDFASTGGSYIIVGGQNGTWFRPGQYPRLSVISMENFATTRLTTVPGQGSVWSGSWNGSEWFVSGWGENKSDSYPTNPYLQIYFDNGSLLASLDPPSNYTNQELEWNGGDIFSASSNGTQWLVSGLGSGILPSYSHKVTNHFSVGLFNGTYFSDLSSKLPKQWDGIMYANAYNGSEWLLGGGWKYRGVLYSFNGTAFTDLTSDIASVLHSLPTVTSMGWNGHYWLIGGAGFLVKYNGSAFSDLTQDLNDTLRSNSYKLTSPGLNSVNSIEWDGSEWLLGGGLPKAYDSGPSTAWIASYDSSNFTDRSYLLPKYSSPEPVKSSAVLSIAYLPSMESWIVGGYANNQSMLLQIDRGSKTLDFSSLVSDMSYISWVGASS